MDQIYGLNFIYNGDDVINAICAFIGRHVQIHKRSTIYRMQNLGQIFGYEKRIFGKILEVPLVFITICCRNDLLHSEDVAISVSAPGAEQKAGMISCDLEVIRK